MIRRLLRESQPHRLRDLSRCMLSSGRVRETNTAATLDHSMRGSCEGVTVHVQFGEDLGRVLAEAGWPPVDTCRSA
jgi:hypothetical protein